MPLDWNEWQPRASGAPKMGPLTREETEAEDWQKRAKELFESLPQPSIQPLPEEHAFDLSKYQNQLGCTPAEAWQKCAEVIEKYDANTCKAHREEIDTLLVFAGLFSAVVTAFTVESYQWLQRDANDAIIVLLSRIAHPDNATVAASVSTGLPEAISARINTYWFLSLTLSLTASLVAILCKQWVREFERRADQSHERYISVRQTKLEGFEGWGVSSVVAAVPLLLQSALGLFALGMVELLWTLHKLVAVVILIPTAGAVIFYCATTLLPSLQMLFGPFRTLRALPQCPFKSPQALLILRVHSLLREVFWSWYDDPVESTASVYFQCSYRKCLVFCRRLRAAVSPQYRLRLQNRLFQSQDRPEVTAQSGSEELQGRFRSFRRQLLAPWNCDECMFYLHHDREDCDDLRSRWMHIPLPCWGPHYDNARYLRPPKLYCESWHSFDREFSRLRDNAYADQEYADVVFGNGVAIPPMACFRGFEWLLKHADHPDLRKWVWLAVWGLSHDWDHQPVALRHGIFHLTAGAAKDRLLQAHTHRELALIYAVELGIDMRVRGELFVHLVPYIRADVSRWLWSTPGYGNDDIWKAGLEAMLSNAFHRSPWTRSTPLFSYLATQALPHARALISQQELACLIALHFGDRLAKGKDVVDGDTTSLELVDFMLVALAYYWDGTLEQSGAVQSTFSALAMACDIWMAQAEARGLTMHIPIGLHDPSIRKVYLDLLRPGIDGLDSPSGEIVAAKSRVMCQITRWRESIGFVNHNSLEGSNPDSRVQPAQAPGAAQHDGQPDQCSETAGRTSVSEPSPT